MEVDKFPFGLGSSGSNPNKCLLVKALKEFSLQQTTPPDKRISVDPVATDTIRVEVNKVLFHCC
jgi:hypothetical protein